MAKLVSIGELLIDFIACEKGVSLQASETFKKAAGGAPSNVACCVAKLGASCTLVSQVGQDAFGDFLVETLKQNHVDTSNVYRTNKAKTAISFASIIKDGQNDYVFYRNPSADMLLESKFVSKDVLEEDDIFHFGSVALISSPFKRAHDKLILAAIKKKCIIVFDPNVRKHLWGNLEEYQSTIQEYIPYAHILKVSDDELEFITNSAKEQTAVQLLFKGNVHVVIVTKGRYGVTLYLKDGRSFYHRAYSVDIVDTIGAGDAFIGAFIYQLLEHGVSLKKFTELSETEIIEYLSFASKVAALVVSKHGAISSLPTLEEVEAFEK